MALWAPLLLSLQISGGGFDKIAQLPGALDGDGMGSVVAALGDLDGDGLLDFAASAPDHSPGGLIRAGLLNVYAGNGTGVLHQFIGTASYQTLGRAVVGLDDLDGDAVPDYAFSSDAQGGTVFLVSGASGTVFQTWSNPVGAGDFGQALAPIGDYDGDGIPDLAVGDGAFDFDDGLGTVLVDAGAVWLLSGADGSTLALFTGSQAGARMGSLLAVPGDSSGDGVVDLLAAARTYDSGPSLDAGAVFLLSGSDGSVLQTWTGNRAGALFPSALAAVGDSDGDGLGDFLAGDALDASAGLFQQGSVLHYSTAAGGPLLFRWDGIYPAEQLGAAVASTGDIDQDGVADLMLGAPGPAWGGRVYYYSGSDHRLLFISESDGPVDRFGAALAALGDLEGDGRTELLVGAPGAADGALFPGRLHLLSFRRFANPPRAELSALTGGTATFQLKFPNDYLIQEDRLYYTTFLAEQLGTTQVMDWSIPLANDSLFMRSMVGNYPSEVRTPGGLLTPGGGGTVQVVLPAGLPPALIGQSWYLAFGAYEFTDGGQLVIHAVSRSVEVTVLP